MWRKFRQGVGRNWIGALECFILGIVLFLPGNASAQATTTNAIPTTPVVNIPADATPEITEFLQNRAILKQKLEQWRSQQPAGGFDPKAFAQFQQQNADLLTRQSVLAQAITQQQAGNAMPTPPPLQIPSDASPQLKAFLTTRDQLFRNQVSFLNQHLNDDPATRQLAMQQWQQQNSALFQQMQQEAQAVAQSNPSQPPGK